MTVLHAFEIRSEVSRYPFFADFREACENVARETLESGRDLTVDCAAEVRFETAQGKPADVLTREAEKRRASLIVVGSRGFGPLRAALGSVTLRLLQSARCPVLVVTEGRPPEPCTG